ncbi:hypothetical protein L1D37_15830 [Vibrio sp. Isolate33]|uniref:hypothetical protein n=1 Tax=Vibrio sp. Isolate33 TaxID=2908539 RepID=UPI001EFD4BC5|nr:hypothetical protein [Vibrio sp. Isolate33]MCG9545213.1 hypothetical protein [Vibrio sp. Isolate33]
MRKAKLAIFVCVSAIGALILAIVLLTPPLVLRGSQWACNLKQMGFVTPSYAQYSELNEFMLYSFSSDEDFFVSDRIQTLNQQGDVETAEVVFVGKYALNDNQLEMVFNEVNFRHKHPNEMINRNQQLYKGFTIQYEIELEGDFLYLYSSNNSEEFNHICTKR